MLEHIADFTAWPILTGIFFGYLRDNQRRRKDMNPIAILLLNQQLVAPQFNDPAEVVSYMGAMQAQKYRMMCCGHSFATMVSLSPCIRTTVGQQRN